MHLKYDQSLTQVCQVSRHGSLAGYKVFEYAGSVKIDRLVEYSRTLRKHEAYLEWLGRLYERVRSSCKINEISQCEESSNVNLRENALHSRPANEPNPAPPTIRWHNVAVRRMACISEMLGERRRVMMRMRDAKWRVYITSKIMNRWLTSSPVLG